eukprot:411221-Pyramimonas_sp.AAC.1
MSSATTASEAFWRRSLGAMLGFSWGPREPPVALLRPSWGSLGAFLGPSSGPLGRGMGGLLGPSEPPWFKRKGGFSPPPRSSDAQ